MGVDLHKAIMEDSEKAIQEDLKEEKELATEDQGKSFSSRGNNIVQGLESRVCWGWGMARDSAGDPGGDKRDVPQSISAAITKTPQAEQLKQQTFISHHSAGWEVQDQGASRFGVW